MYVTTGINDDLGFDFGALITSAAPLVDTGVKTYGQVQAIRNQPRTAVQQLIPQPAQPQVIVTQPAPVAAPKPKSKLGQYLTIGALVVLGLGGGMMYARSKKRR